MLLVPVTIAAVIMVVAATMIVVGGLASALAILGLL